MPALDRNHQIHNERRPMPEPRRNPIGVALRVSPVAVVLWVIIIAAVWHLATHAPEGWWVL